MLRAGGAIETGNGAIMTLDRRRLRRGGRLASVVASRARATIIGACVLGVLVLGSAAGSSSAAAAPIALQIPESTAFAVLGHWCGGIFQHDYGTAFDARTGYPDGDSYVWTTCGGRGWSHTYSAWLSATWDFTGSLVSYKVLSGTPTVNPTLSVYDAHGNHLYNQTNQAHLQLAAGFVPAPRVAGISPSSAPQGSTVTISGTSFTGATRVLFGTTAAPSFVVNNGSTITAIAPAIRTGTVDVTVTGPGGRSMVNSGDRFTFNLTPRIGGLSPNQGSADGGTIVTISGVNFTGATGVTFGGVGGPATFKVINDTTIQAVAPGATDPAVVDVVVGSAAGYSAATAADKFTYF